jgi:hypothetical protein
MGVKKTPRKGYPTARVAMKSDRWMIALFFVQSLLLIVFLHLSLRMWCMRSQQVQGFTASSMPLYPFEGVPHLDPTAGRLDRPLFAPSTQLPEPTIQAANVMPDLVSQAWKNEDSLVSDAWKSTPEGFVNRDPIDAPTETALLPPTPNPDTDVRADGLNLFEDDRMFTGSIMEGVCGWDSNGTWGTPIDSPFTLSSGDIHRA